MSGCENIIYALVDPRSKLVRYIGKSTSGVRRPREHLRPSSYAKQLHSAAWIRSLMAVGARPDICVLEETTQECLNDAERAWILYFRSLGCNLTNHTDGGDGMYGWVMHPHAKAKMVAAKVGRKQSPEHAAKSRDALEKARHKQRSPEAIEKIRQYWAKPESRAAVSVRFKGTTKSPETLAKMSAWQKGRPKSPEHAAKIRARLSVPMSAERRAHLSALAKQRYAARKASESA